VPREIETNPKLFHLYHYQTVHAVSSCILGSQICLGIGILASCARMLATFASYPVLQVALTLVLVIALLQLPGVLSLSIKILMKDCSDACANESLDANLLWLPVEIIAALALDFTGLPALLQFMGIGFSSVLGILIPFLVAALIFWLPVATGRAAQLELEAKSN
jgi:hypothetical protein